MLPSRTTGNLELLNLHVGETPTLHAVICDSPVVRKCHPGYLGILAAHREEEQREDVANQRRAKGEPGCSHDVQLQPLHQQTSRKHPQCHSGDIDHAWD